MDAIQSFKTGLYQGFHADLETRVARAAVHLVQETQKAYDTVLKIKGGPGVGSLTHELRWAGKTLEALVGPSTAGKYMAYLEFGVRGTGGGTGYFARSKAPPIRNIYQWILLAGIAPKKSLVKRAEANQKRGSSDHKHPKFDQKKDKPWYSSDPLIILAFFIAQKQKKFGRPALRVFERTIQAQTARMQDIINNS